MFRGPAGLASLMKEGGSHYKGTDEAVLKNIDACKRLCETIKTSYGPTGMCKLINNFIEKRFLSRDSNTVVSELEVQHPAAKMVVMGGQMQHREFGDHSNFAMLFACMLLDGAGELITDGIHQNFVIKGYEMALAKSLEFADRAVLTRLSGLEEAALRPVIASKLSGQKNIDKMVKLVTDACTPIIDGERLEGDNVRVTKIVGATLAESCTVNGMVLSREPKTDCRSKTNCKIIVLGTPLEGVHTESTSTVLIQNAEQMLNFSKSEEAETEGLIKSWADAGIEAVICGGSISPLALHYLNKYNMWAVATSSKFDIKRLARTLRVPALARAGVPMAEEIGLAEYVGVEEYGSQLVCVIRGKDTRVSTILLRGSTGPFLDECERAVDDCVSLIRASLKDNRFVAGAGAFEMTLSQQLYKYSSTIQSLEQYAIKKFADTLAEFPKLIAENAGHNALETLAKLCTKHAAGDSNSGVDVTKPDAVRDVTRPILDLAPFAPFAELAFPVYDHFLSKQCALKLAVDVVTTLLRVDHIIMSKPAGGPKLPNQGHWDAADDRAGFTQ